MTLHPHMTLYSRERASSAFRPNQRCCRYYAQRGGVKIHPTHPKMAFHTEGPLKQNSSVDSGLQRRSVWSIPGTLSEYGFAQRRSQKYTPSGNGVIHRGCDTTHSLHHSKMVLYNWGALKWIPSEGGVFRRGGGVKTCFILRWRFWQTKTIKWNTLHLKIWRYIPRGHQNTYNLSEDCVVHRGDARINAQHPKMIFHKEEASKRSPSKDGVSQTGDIRMHSIQT